MSGRVASSILSWFVTEADRDELAFCEHGTEAWDIGGDVFVN